MARFGILRAWAAAAACVLVWGCGGSSNGTGGGTLEGTWTLDSATCNGTAISFGGAAITINISGSSGNFTTKLTNNGTTCSMIEDISVAYPSTGSFTFTMDTTVNCSPSSCAGSYCGTATGNQVLSGTYTINGNQANVTIPQTPSNNSNCASGQEVMVLTQQ